MTLRHFQISFPKGYAQPSMSGPTHRSMKELIGSRWLTVPLLAALLRAATPGHAAAPATIWAAPLGERLCEDYTLRVNGQPVPVHACRVSAVPFNQVWPGKIQLKSGETLYVAGGAVVYTAGEARGAYGVRILGRGIIDTSEFERGQGDGCIRLTDCSDVKVEGVILRDPDVRCLSAFGCRNVEIANVKLVGLWRYNADGIDLCNCQDVLIRSSPGSAGGYPPAPPQTRTSRFPRIRFLGSRLRCVDGVYDSRLGQVEEGQQPVHPVPGHPFWVAPARQPAPPYPNHFLPIPLQGCGVARDAEIPKVAFELPSQSLHLHPQRLVQV